MDIKLKPGDNLYITFFASYLALAGTTVITFLGSLGDFEDKNSKYLKYALISETCVNIIAGLTYSYIMQLLTNGLNLNKITPIRYIDWVLTTPLLLFSFVLYLSYLDNKNNKNIQESSFVIKEPDFSPLFYIIPLNFLMLLFGYLGETGMMDHKRALVYGFCAYIGLFASLYEAYIKDNSDQVAINLFVAFSLVWLLYGVTYLLDMKYKNIAYNILDIVSKAGFGVLIWGSSFDN